MGEIMRGSIFDFIGNLDTLLAVLLGALLATGGSLLAEIIQDRLGRKRRQRDAARFFGEIITSMGHIFDLACDSQKIGDRWGRYSQVLFETASQEAAVYERNRERLFDVGDMKLRFAIHNNMLRTISPLANVIEHTKHIEHLETKLAEDVMSETARNALKERIARLDAFREGSLASAQSQREKASDVLGRLEALAGVKFDARY